MKIFTKLLIVGSALMATSLMPAQDASEASNGYTYSKENGIVSKLLRWENFRPMNTHSNIYDPHQKMLAALGVRQTVVTPLADEYEFYGGDSYKGNNIPFASVTDAAGNTYITGGSTSESQPSGDFFTIKVNTQGEVVWEARKAAAKYAVDYGMQLQLDAVGNLVVTGLKWNGNDMDIQTVKYTPDGTELWASTYNSPFEGVDIPSAITTAADGSIFITGISWSGSSTDYITLKYTASGELAWQVRDNGIGSDSWNEPAAITLDTAGNIIVTGFNTNPEGWLNYYTVKYDSNGEEVWTRTYNYESTDPDNPAEVTNSTARAVVTDADNNIYITGTFDTFLGRIGTIKYNATGEQQWIQTYKIGDEKTTGWKASINNNKLYIAGIHNGSFANDGTVLITYSLAGTQNWLKETNNLIDAGNVSLLFDAAGNPVVAAKGMTPGAEEWQPDTAARATKYSADGNELGQAAFVISSPEGLASMGDMAGAGLDNSGNIYLTVNSFYSDEGAVYETVKSGFGTTSPTASWSAVYTNTGSPAASMLNSVADGYGNTIATGTYYTFADGMLNPNYFVVKHNADGDIAWESVYNADNGNAANGIIAEPDKDGNIFVCLVPDFDAPIKLKKLSPAGTELWQQEIPLINPQVYVLETGADGSVYLGGTAFSGENDEHTMYVGLKYSPTGTQVWGTYFADANVTNNIYGINSGKVTEAGELILTGVIGSGDFISQDTDLAVIKFNSNGLGAWIAPVEIAGNSSSGTDLLIDNNGSIYTNGFAIDDSGMEDIVTAKISTDGVVQWVQVYGEVNRKERSYTLKEFSTGDIAVVGYSLAANGDINNVLIKYDVNGNQVWDYASENMRYYNDFHIDGSDVCYIMDQAIIETYPHKISNAPFPIATLVRVDAQGNGEEEFFVGPGYSEFYGERLIPHADNRLLLGGSAGNQAYFQGVYYFETEHDGSLSTGSFSAVADTNNLGQNYPNPVAGETTIPFYLKDGGNASLKLYNSQGRLVKTIANKQFAAGFNTVTFNADGLQDGIYFYSITCGRFKQARKMLINN